MRTILTSFIFCILTLCSQAQTNWVFTNDVAIGNAHWDVKMHFSYGDKKNIEVKAGDVNRLKLWNTVTNIMGYFIIVPRSEIQWSLSPSPFLHLTLMTTNGMMIPSTTQGKPFIIEPKRHTKNMVVTDATWEMPKLTDLFNFPSNGEYILEARIWWWSPPDKRLFLSDPVRIKVIAQNIASTNAMSK
jgi:hypothetical protein